MKSLYCAAKISPEWRLNFYRQTPQMLIRAAEVTGTHVPKYGFSGKNPEEAEAFSTKEKLYHFMRSRPENEGVFPYIVVQSVER